jgi:hypothetical protein
MKFFCGERERDGDVEKMFDLRDDDVMLMILNP